MWDDQRASEGAGGVGRWLRQHCFKDPVSATTHFAGFLAALGAGAFLLQRASGEPRAEFAAVAVYGATLVVLFLASSVYHFFDLGERGNRWLRRLDHAAVFLLIAGTYLPVLVHTLEGAWLWTMLGAITAIALGGIVLKLVWIDAPTWLGVGLYLAMGWIAVVPAGAILPQLSGSSLAWLGAGGLAYTAGAVIYAARWPDPWPERFGHHEIWHLFVLAGAAAHFVSIDRIVGS